MFISEFTYRMELIKKNEVTGNPLILKQKKLWLFWVCLLIASLSCTSPWASTQPFHQPQALQTLLLMCCVYAVTCILLFTY